MDPELLRHAACPRPRMKNVVFWVGVLALVGWTALGAAAWMLAREGVTVVLGSAEPSRLPEDERNAVLEEQVARVEEGLRGLASTLASNLEILDGRCAERSEALRSDIRQDVAEAVRAGSAPGRGAALDACVARIETSVLGIQRALAIRDAAPPPQPPAPQAALRTEVETAAAPATVAGDSQVDGRPAPAKKSFLAFELPSDDFRFDERREWRIVPSLSRVGFDGVSTLHDFTGMTSAVAGGFELDLAHPGERPTGAIEAEARSLATADEDRDEAMYETIEASEHPKIRFEILSCRETAIDAAGRTVRAEVRGRMNLHGATREIAMPVRVSVDSGNRLLVEGEAPLLLSDFGIEAPSKLGVISMDDRIKIWVALRARLLPRDDS